MVDIAKQGAILLGLLCSWILVCGGSTKAIELLAGTVGVRQSSWFKRVLRSIPVAVGVVTSFVFIPWVLQEGGAPVLSYRQRVILGVSFGAAVGGMTRRMYDGILKNLDAATDRLWGGRDES